MSLIVQLHYKNFPDDSAKKQDQLDVAIGEFIRPEDCYYHLTARFISEPLRLHGRYHLSLRSLEHEHARRFARNDDGCAP